MSEHLISVLAGPGRDVPARAAGLRLPMDVEIVSMQVSHPPDSNMWWIQLAVRVPATERLELLTKRLNRLVDVHQVVTLKQNVHLRQSVYVSLRSHTADLVEVGELARWFGAEMLELGNEALVLHLTATPERCHAFASLLRPHGVIEIVTNAVSGFRAHPRFQQTFSPKKGGSYGQRVSKHQH
jgi:acetolactate synthase-1/3 small subunit